MDVTTPNIAATTSQPYSLPIDNLMDKCQQMMQNYWDENPDLYRIVQQKKRKEAANDSLQKTLKNSTQSIAAVATETKTNSLFDQPLRGAKLRARIQESHSGIRQHVLEVNADIIPRTQAHNRKSSHQSLKEEIDFRADVMAEQIRAWRGMLPTLIRKFSKIPDYRRAGSVKHKITALMVFGLFGFVFRLSSRREMNRELTGPVIFEHLKKLFPELDSIPHADTLARALENINPQLIEAIHINLVKELINKKKFKTFLIKGCVPITVDGTQKLYRRMIPVAVHR